METGESIETFLKDFPSVRRELILQLLEHAEKLISLEELS